MVLFTANAIVGIPETLYEEGHLGPETVLSLPGSRIDYARKALSAQAG